MNELDDRPLIRTAQIDQDQTVMPPPSASRRPVLIVIAVLGAVLGAAGAWWWTQDRVTPPPTRSGPATGTDAMVTPREPASRTLPPLSQMDTFLRALLGALSPSPDLARWLATDDLIRQMASAIDRVSRGLSPAPDLAILRPRGSFDTAGPRDRLTIAPASFRRYDSLANIVSSVDARAVADAYRTIQPRLDEAYRGLGRSEGTVDNAVVTALQMLIDTPALPEPIEIIPGKGATYAYADPRVESLRPVQKQLLRMGPANVGRVQARLREIQQAIATSARP